MMAQTAHVQATAHAAATIASTPTGPATAATIAAVPMPHPAIFAMCGTLPAPIGCNAYALHRVHGCHVCHNDCHAYTYTGRLPRVPHTVLEPSCCTWDTVCAA